MRPASTTRGSHGAWQKFERGEIPLLAFYAQFGADLSDAARANAWYREYCERKRIGALSHRSLSPPQQLTPATLHLPRMSRPA